MWNTFLNWLANLLKPTPKPTPAPTPSPTPDVTFRTQLENLHNSHRNSKGLHLLSQDAKLNNAAQKHSDWMLSNNTLNHYEGSKRVGDRVKDEGFSWSMVGENIAYGYTSPSSVFQGWLNSSGHRANIENPNYTHVGFGVAGKYWTVVFATPSKRMGVQENCEPEGIVYQEPDHFVMPWMP
jgi:uncharacterized protein YkwD